MVVLQEHGDWGSNSAHIAQALVTTYVNKQRKRDNNIRIATVTDAAKPVDAQAASSASKPSTPTSE